MMLSRETSFPSSIHRSKGLRSLFIGNTRGSWLGAALPNVMKQLTCIRSLNVSGSSIKEIPKEVGKLIHLRHLNFKGCRKLVSLSETMCDLCNLQSLNVFQCSSLKELPQAIVKLVNLRHLRTCYSSVAFMPKGIGRLTCLRTLDCFTLCGDGENESKAANLRELKNLDHIGGSLVIENIRGGGIEDAAKAQLKNKKHLLCLKLNFDLYHKDGILIEILQPSLDLERLSINLYGGIVLPNWMMALTRLQDLELIDCGNLEVLPPLGRLPTLEFLQLYSVAVRRLGAGFVGIAVENAKINEGEIARVTAFPKLRRLVISFLFKLEEWDGIERRVGEEDATTTSIFIMPQLQKLSLIDCTLLRALPDYVLAAPLQVLHVVECPNLSKRYGKEEKGAVPGTSSSTQNGGPVILELRLDKVRRPLMRTRANDQNKVKELMDSIKEIGLQVPLNANINEGDIAFLKLKSLQIWGLKEVEEWDGIERRLGEEDATTTSIFIMPQLQHLRIHERPLLRI
ncbi:hypothetical protein SADUNF_Sadunf12G0097200 [Salix dunnii]|uniref:Disease resistance R13L4/SHOC-2-like LRR domain-containing protein n=1 Tax=Salix dunnii TaxID=1413687 RepID=A0A835MMC5_9ROSI|nr:hypothetical protein SADUNF_Sadunf12G0097200 [Salix dunnii]